MQGSQLQVAEAGFTPDTNEACACSPSQAVFLIWRTHHQPTQYLAKCLVLRRHLIKIYCININTKGVYNLTFRRDHRDLALCWRKAKLRKVRLVIELTTRRECLSLRTVPPSTLLAQAPGRTFTGKQDGVQARCPHSLVLILT